MQLYKVLPTLSLSKVVILMYKKMYVKNSSLCQKLIRQNSRKNKEHFTSINFAILADKLIIHAKMQQFDFKLIKLQLQKLFPKHQNLNFMTARSKV